MADLEEHLGKLTAKRDTTQRELQHYAKHDCDPRYYELQPAAEKRLTRYERNIAGTLELIGERDTKEVRAAQNEVLDYHAIDRDDPELMSVIKGMEARGETVDIDEWQARVENFCIKRGRQLDTLSSVGAMVGSAGANAGVPEKSEDLLSEISELQRHPYQGDNWQRLQALLKRIPRK